MNKDTSCVHMLEIDENVMSTAYTTYTNGVVVTQDHEGEQGCWSYIGKCAGCGGNPRHVFKSSYIICPQAFTSLVKIFGQSEAGAV